MSRQPKVGVENRLEHHHGVTAECEIVGHDLGGETNHGGHRQPDGVFPERFKDQPEADRAPSDKNGRAVEIGDRRAPLQPHPGDEPQRVDHEGQLHQMQGRLAAPFGEVEPEPAAEEEGHNVQRGRLRERRKAIVKLLARRLVQGLAQAERLQVSLIIGHRSIEARDLTRAEGVSHRRPMPHRRRQRPSTRRSNALGHGFGREFGLGNAHQVLEQRRPEAGIQQGLAHALPGKGIAPIRRWNQ